MRNDKFPELLINMVKYLSLPETRKRALSLKQLLFAYQIVNVLIQKPVFGSSIVICALRTFFRVLIQENHREQLPIRNQTALNNHNYYSCLFMVMLIRSILNKGILLRCLLLCIDFEKLVVCWRTHIIIVNYCDTNYLHIRC